MKAINSYEAFEAPSEHLDTICDEGTNVERLTDQQRQFVQENFDLVHSVASFMIYGQGLRMELDEAIGYGSVGLCKAVQRFDPSNGASLQTYARTRIRGAILDGIRSFDKIDRQTGLPRAVSVLNGSLGVSIDRPLGEYSGLIFANTLIDESLTSEEQYVACDERNERTVLARELFSRLNNKEKAVVVGIAQERKLVDIADELSVTGARVSQMKKEIAKKAHDPNRRTALELKKEKDDRYVNPAHLPAIFAIGALKSQIKATQSLISANELLTEPDNQYLDRLRLTLAQLTYSLVNIPQVKRVL
ncbi:MAG TPA: sigma-70 family RNA polymerase sigma factor [Candidatus Saccharimonadales bacterium]